MIADHGGMANWHWHDFARQLERELAERTEERDEALGAVRVERACRELAALRSCQGPLGFVIATEMNGVMCVSDPAYRTRESAEADAELPRARGIKSEVLGCYREAPLSPLAAQYEELLYAVARKYPGETRHETALRYIRQAEERTGDTGAAKASV